MLDLTHIDLGKDEAEQDQQLREYFLKTSSYENALSGRKTIVIGRKGSGKSAILKLMQDELVEAGSLVIVITPDQYSWGALKDYREQGILAVQAHTNAWELTLLSAIVWKFNEAKLLPTRSKLLKYYRYLSESYGVDQQNWFYSVVESVKRLLSGVKTQWFSLDLGVSSTVATPLRAVEEIQSLLLLDWPSDRRVRILIDRLDDSWDGSTDSQNLIIGLLKAANNVNTKFQDKVIVTVFLRSDIYDYLLFHDQDKLRQNEETLFWNNEDLIKVVAERVRYSLKLTGDTVAHDIWRELFADRLYRSKASPEKYIIDRTFKRPRDIISFVRLAIETAVRYGNSQIAPSDTRIAEEEKYSQSKYKDLIIEYQNQFPYVKDLLDSFSGSLHKLSKKELILRLEDFVKPKSLTERPEILLRQLFTWGVIGVKRQGRAGVRQRGGAHFYYYYEDPSINPLQYDDFYIHPSLRYYLNISEKRERRTRQQEADSLTE